MPLSRQPARKSQWKLKSALLNVGCQSASSGTVMLNQRCGHNQQQDRNKSVGCPSTVNAQLVRLNSRLDDCCIFMGTFMKQLAAIALFLLIGSSDQALSAPTYSFVDLGVVYRVTGLNDIGQVIGYRSGGTKEHGFLYGSAGMMDLGPTARPTSINNKGQVVGVVPSASGAGVRSYFLTGSGTGWVEIGNLSGYSKIEASMINKSGQILLFFLGELAGIYCERNSLIGYRVTWWLFCKGV